MMNDVRVEVGGTLFGGWTSVRIDAGITKLARDFAVAFTRTSGAGGIRIGVKPGDAVRVYIDSDLVLTGYVSDMELAYAATAVTLTMRGFSKTVDLCECQVPPGSPLSFKKTSIQSIIKRLAGLYGIGVDVQVDASKSIDWDVSPTETIKSTLEKMLKQHTMLLTDNDRGELVVLKAGGGGRASDVLATGKNLLSATYALDAKSLFSEYAVLGQGANATSERPVTDAQVTAKALFDGIRHRVSVYSQSGDATAAELQRRARLLRDNAAGNSETYRCQLQGWRQSDGALWTVNQLVRVRDEFFELDKYFLVSDVSFSLSKNGSVTDLVLRPLGAFIETDLPDKAKAAKEAASVNTVVRKSDTAVAEWTNK